MRCPNCSKFVSLENGDPEVEQCEIEYGDGSFTINASVMTKRNCADCSDTMKELQRDMEKEVELSEFEGWAKLSKEQQEQIIAGLASGELEAEVSNDEGTVDEGGGGRYKKNIITLVLPFTVEIDLKEFGEVEPEKRFPVEKLTLNSELTDEAAASAYEECC